MPFAAFGQFDSTAIDNTNLMARQWSTAGDEAQRCAGIRFDGQCIATGLERVALYPVDQRSSVQGRKGHAQRSLGQPIDRRQRGRGQAVAYETFGEALQGLRADRFGTVEGQAPTAQVQTLEIVVSEFVQTQLVGEVGRRRHRAAEAVDGP
ncbi:hypothetical protein D3C81_1382690 [compost metagenome]